MTWPWPASESTGAVLPAYVKALQQIRALGSVKKNKKVNAGQMNYSFADLAAVLDASSEVLTTNGLAIAQPPSDAGVHTMLLHESGEWLSFGSLHIQTAQTTPQAQGSGLSFARRYAQLGTLNIATEDDDGKAAAAEPKPPRQTKPRNAPTGEDHQDSGAGPSRKQINMLMAIYGRLGVTVRAEQKILAAGVLGIPTVTSHNDLTVAQISELIDALVDVQAGGRDLVLNDDGIAIAVTKPKDAA